MIKQRQNRQNVKSMTSIISDQHAGEQKYSANQARNFNLKNQFKPVTPLRKSVVSIPIANRDEEKMTSPMSTEQFRDQKHSEVYSCLS